MEAVLGLARRVLDRAGAHAGELEAYVEHRVVTTVQAGADAEIRHVGHADTRGVGVRAVLGDHVGYASTSDISDVGLDAVVSSARANAEVGDADPAGASLAAPAQARPIDGLCLPALTELGAQAKAALVTDLARRVTSLDPRISRLDTAEWRDEHRRVAVLSTTGVQVAYETAFAELSSDALGEDASTGAVDYGYWWGRDPGEVDVEALARDAVSRTLRLLGPAAAAREVDTVVLDPEVAGLVLHAAGRGLTGAALGNRRSPFAGRHADAVAAEFLSVADDGRCPAGPGGAPVDDEGVPRRLTPLIDNGVLVGALHSQATAASAGASTTGNARRSSHKAAPRAAASVLRVTPTAGVDVPGVAAYVQQVSGSVAGISPVTGRVSLGGVGYLLRAGEPVGRLPTMPIATSVLALLTELVAVGGDARVVPGQSALAPTLVWRPSKPLSW